MITISQLVSEIVKISPFLEEGLAARIINLSALARRLKLQIERRTLKKSSVSAIVMALQRLGVKLRNKQKNKVILPQDITVRSNLIELTYSNSPTLREKLPKTLQLAEKRKDVFFNILQGLFETSIIASQSLIGDLKQYFKNEKLVLKTENLASVTLRYSEDAIFTPGVYYLILKNLAWEGINVVEVISIHNELSLIVEQLKVDRAFQVIKTLSTPSSSPSPRFDEAGPSQGGEKIDF